MSASAYMQNKNNNPRPFHHELSGIGIIWYLAFIRNLSIDFFKRIGTASVEAVNTDLTFRQTYRLDKCEYTVLIR